MKENTDYRRTLLSHVNLLFTCCSLYPPASSPWIAVIVCSPAPSLSAPWSPQPTLPPVLQSLAERHLAALTDARVAALSSAVPPAHTQK